MEQSTLTILALYGLFGIALVTLWLRHQSVLKQREQMQIRLGNLQGNLTNTSNRLDLLSRGVDTILGETPEVHELLSVHKSLESAESLLFEQDVTISSSESCAIATHAAKSILSNYQSDSETKGRENILPGVIPLVIRLDAILTEAEMQSEDLELNGEEQRCLGELFHEAGKSVRASDFYRRAHTLSPEGSSVLYSLASIQRDEGDLDTLDRTLERLLAQSIAPARNRTKLKRPLASASDGFPSIHSSNTALAESSLPSFSSISLSNNTVYSPKADARRIACNASLVLSSPAANNLALSNQASEFTESRYIAFSTDSNAALISPKSNNLADLATHPSDVEGSFK